ncbi:MULTISPECIES: 6-carboxytetrahydropterin synthase [unclassified Staphylococcus]|uniref:6-pyruvoyl trahydropterin synthase family protein n=1 Tax=unclassified Staphylococcus TaxID=91994 RepID=UPI0021CDED61|nr:MULTISPECIES: 6-carboxytetrahydropterin synthase [unclassified Staphylococcus]UXR69421.1 6-carboxytetrahydropterin synthase [Staphylococcus sp. IVB6246]UXR71477.1 6-carboxytetrahydropterin synthase [Staphylococcus sp. IVB6240]UXR73755.1 6-carboxytetrahydropterin synthase [Staphylococcus sp. IVB6238]UXR76075.1 6-carboxytetrahydropterin synthase [Staphylococcus sp. IVB6233]UXR80273.1 6-carboxytetrahydropterin synthase [Staphylococcus sp. IVB6218]
MSQFDHLQAPKTFAFHQSPVHVLKHYQFTCDNRIYFTNQAYINLPNHTYQLELAFQATTNTQGIAVDFHEIDKLYRTHLAPYLDGQLLNDTLPEMSTTAENIAYWIWQQLTAVLPSDVMLHTLVLKETPEQGIKLTHDLLT